MGRIDSLAIKTLHRVRKFWELFILTVLIGGTFITVWAVARPGNVFDPRRYAADNMCNVDGRTCSKPEEWEKGWIEARQTENVDKAPVQNEYTSANPANDSSQGVTQEAQIIRQAGESNEVNRSSIAAEEAAKKNDPVNKPVVTDPTLPPLLPTTAVVPTSAVQPTGGLTPTVVPSVILSPTAPPATATPAPITATPAPERYGVTDNICHLPGANCTGEDWQKGNAAARGDTKALSELQQKNPTAFTGVTVDGGIVKQNSPTTAPVVPTTAQAATATTDAQTRRAEFTKQCAKDLHLCPMIDPNTFQVVGWVPADEASFGTFEDAKLARQKLSIGDLRKYNIPELLSEDKLRSATADEMQKELTKAFSGAEGAKLIDQLKNTPSGSLVKLDSQGSAVKTKDGDIVLNSGESLSKKTQVGLEKKYLEERVADAKTQDDTANALLASLASKLEDCLKEGKTPDGACGISKLTQAEKQKYDELTDDRKKEISSGQTFKKLQKGVSDSYNQEKLAIESLARGGTAAVTAQCVAERGEHLCNTAAQIDLYIAGLANGFDASTEDKIKATYNSKKKEEKEKFVSKLHDGDITRVRQDIEKNIEQAASMFISITVKPEDRNQAVRQLVYGNIDFSKYPNLTEAEKQEFHKDYFNRRYFAIQTYLTSDEIKNYQAEINVLKQELPQPGGGGGLKSIAKTPQTTQQLTPIQQAQLTAAQTGLGIVNWWNNTGLAQGINKRATDLGVINAQSPEEAAGKFLNTTTAGAFGQYVATYADINAQNPDASYLNKAFNPQGLDASQALLAQTVTATLPDNGQYSGQIVNGVFNAPLIGARRYIDAGVAGSAALANNNTGQLLQANAYGAYHIFGIDDTVNASNRLFYQTGMSSVEAEAYVNNPWLRAGDAFTVGMAAVSIGDVTASIKVSGLEKTLIQGPLSQRGIEQGTNLFAKGYQSGNGSIAGNISSGINAVYNEGMPNTNMFIEGTIVDMDDLAKDIRKFLKTGDKKEVVDVLEQKTTGLQYSDSEIGQLKENVKIAQTKFQQSTSSLNQIESDLKKLNKGYADATNEQVRKRISAQVKELGTKKLDALSLVESTELAWRKAQTDLKLPQLIRILQKKTGEERSQLVEQLSDRIAENISGVDKNGIKIGNPSAAALPKGFQVAYPDIIRDSPETASFIHDAGVRTVEKLFGGSTIADPDFARLLAETEGNISGGLPPVEAIQKTMSNYIGPDKKIAEPLQSSIIAPFRKNGKSSPSMVCSSRANCYQVAAVAQDLAQAVSEKTGVDLKSKIILGFDRFAHAATMLDDGSAARVFRYNTNLSNPASFFEETSRKILYGKNGLGSYLPSALGLQP